MTSGRNPLVLVPQHFGCLVFDRRTSRYLPFAREATALLLALQRQPIGVVLSRLADADERHAVLRFVDCFHERGFFDLDGRLHVGDLRRHDAEDRDRRRRRLLTRPTKRRAARVHRIFRCPRGGYGVLYLEPGNSAAPCTGL